MECKKIGKVFFVLVIIGALNWGVIGFFQLDIVAYLFGDMTWVTRGIYTIVGISGIVAFIEHRKCKYCKKGEEPKAIPKV